MYTELAVFLNRILLLLEKYMAVICKIFFRLKIWYIEPRIFSESINILLNPLIPVLRNSTFLFIQRKMLLSFQQNFSLNEQKC